MQNHSFKELQSALQAAESKLHPSILHGLVSGLCCTGFDADKQWQSFLIEQNENQALMATLIEQLFAEIDNQLSDVELGFTPMLPDESDSLTLKAKCMVGWSQAFIRSYEWAQQQEHKPLDLEIEQFITDIMSISELDIEEMEDEDEQDFLEIFEHLKVCVLNVYTETALKQKCEDSAPNTPTKKEPVDLFSEFSALTSMDDDTTIH